jgi:hypothetical protein
MKRATARPHPLYTRPLNGSDPCFRRENRGRLELALDVLS